MIRNTSILEHSLNIALVLSIFTLNGCGQIVQSGSKLTTIETIQPMEPVSFGSGKFIVESCTTEIEALPGEVCTDLIMQTEYGLLINNAYAENEADNPKNNVKLAILSADKQSSLTRLWGPLADADDMGVLVEVYDRKSGSLTGSAVIVFKNTSQGVYSIKMMSDQTSKKIVEFLLSGTGE